MYFTKLLLSNLDVYMIVKETKSASLLDKYPKKSKSKQYTRRYVEVKVHQVSGFYRCIKNNKNVQKGQMCVCRALLI